MKRKVVEFTWENEDAQAAFTEFVPFPGASYTSNEVDRIEALVGLTPPSRVLDVGCGNGRHAIEMTKRGYQVIGIDVAKLYLAEAKENASSAGVKVEFRCQRGSELCEVAEYDFCLANAVTLGFMSEDELEKQFKAIYTALKPETSFLYVFAGPRLIPGREEESSRTWKEEDGKFILVDKSLVEGYREEYCVVIDAASGEVTEYREHQRAMAFEDVVDQLRLAGFNRVEAYKDFDRNAATPEEFKVFLCKKD